MRLSALTSWLVSLALPLVLTCSSAPRGPLGLGDPGDGMKVLFIANSLTYYYDLPQMVQVVAEAAARANAEYGRR